MSLEQSLARTAKTLSEQYAPDWTIPQPLQWFNLPDRELANIARSSLETLRISRGIWADKLDSIEDGTYYQRGDFGNYIGRDSYYNPRNTNATKFNLDRCEAYHVLWWIDVFINVHTAPSNPS
jgi:hypothetical protein